MMQGPSRSSLPPDVRPNVLRDQTTPNTLGGVGQPTPSARIRRPRPASFPISRLVIVAIVVAIVIAILLGRPG
jgi:hypothetical protein